MNKKPRSIRKQRGRKDDASLHKFVEQVRQLRASLGLPPPEQDSFNSQAAMAEWRHEQVLLETLVMKPTTRSKVRRGIKDDSSLHEFAEEISRRREALGLPPVDNDFDPHKVSAEWHRERGLTPPCARRRRKKASSKTDKRHIRETAILISPAPAPAHGYLAYCPAVNGKGLYGETMAEAESKMTSYLMNLGKPVAPGKALPKTGARVKKVKIAMPSSK